MSNSSYETGRTLQASRPGLDQVFHSREKGTDNPPRLVLTFGP